MKTNLRNPAPFIITICVLVLVCGLHILGEATKDLPEGSLGRVDIFDHIECITYDARVRIAANRLETKDISDRLATLFIDDGAIDRVNKGIFMTALAPAWDGDAEGLDFPAPWPRFTYGQFVREAKAQGAKAVGFDILFSEFDRVSLETAVSTITDRETNTVSSDKFFGDQIAAAGNVVLATQGSLVPKTLFSKGAAAIGNIASKNDYAVLRRVSAFGTYKVWHPGIEERVKSMNLLLDESYSTNIVEINEIVTAQATNQVTVTNFVYYIPTYARGSRTLEADPTQAFIFPLHKNGNVKITKTGDLNISDDADDMGPDTMPLFEMKRAWSLGITLAAMELGLDLNRAVIERNRITLPGTNGVSRIIPTDNSGAFYIDWSLRWDDIRQHKTPVLLGSTLDMFHWDFERYRNSGFTNTTLSNRLVIVGSVATGNNLTDFGDTPLEEKTPLVTKHLNVANSILTGRFVERASNAATLGWIIGFGLLASFLTWRANVVHASVRIALIAILYVAAAFVIYVQTRYWLPIVMPVFGGLLLPHFSLVTYRVVFEQREQRHIKGVFQQLVAPEVVNEILGMPNLTLGGARRDITVYFADVRGFTEFTDTAAAAAEEYVKRNNLSQAEAEAYYDQQAKDTMETVNLYLGIISDQIKKHKGTLDKYIGDCVMAFWGAPLSESQHALYAVRAALDSQRAMHACNQERARQNEVTKVENEARVARGEEPVKLHPLLSLGTGINSGMCIVGMMGSQKHVRSYTVFGREVNIASRLEGVSGRGRIIVSVRTYEDIKKVEPEFAATFVELEAVKVKGIRDAVRIFEVPWREPETHGAATTMISAPLAASEPKTV